MKQSLPYRYLIRIMVLLILLLLAAACVLAYRGGITREAPPSGTQTQPTTQPQAPEETTLPTVLPPEEPVVYFDAEDLILPGEAGTRMRWEPREVPDDAGGPVEFTSSDPGVVTIDDSGVMTTVSPGEAVIHADYGTFEAGRRVIVLPPEPVPQPTDNGDAIPIASVADLRMLAENPGGSYILTNDIQITQEDAIVPIGSGGFTDGRWETEGGFSGTLDGNNHRIRIEAASYQQCSGLFAVITPTGTVKNLNVTAIIHGAKMDDNNALGGIAGYNEGLISHCDVYLDGEAPGTYAMLGGIAGANAGTIAYCEAYGTLSGSGTYKKIGSIAGIQYSQGQGRQNIALVSNTSKENECRLYGYDANQNIRGEPATYTVQFFDDSPKQEDGQAILRHSFQQIVLAESTPQAAQINGSLAQDRQDWMAQLSEDTVDQVYTHPTYEPDSRYWTATSEVTTNDGRILGIRVKTDWFGGGVRNINYYGKTYDLKTGKELTLADILGLPPEQALEEAKQLAGEYFRQTNAPISEESVEACQEADIHYYLQNGELVLEFDTYAVSDGAAGSIHAPTGFYYAP